MEQFLWASLCWISTLCILYLCNNMRYLKSYEKYLVFGGGLLVLPLLFINMLFVILYTGSLVSSSYKVIKIKKEGKNFLIFIGIALLLALINIMYLYLYSR